LSFEQLFEILSSQQRATLVDVCGLSGHDLNVLDQTVPTKSTLCLPTACSRSNRRFVRITPQLDKAFNKLAAHLNKDTGQIVHIVSGYRSPAYQSLLYLNELFVHRFDVAQTRRVIETPGKSEHQDIQRTAVDIKIIGQNDISPEVYEWLSQHASYYGFQNSYPDNNSSDGIIFEPWHWRFMTLS
jgi:LAS superfamily LD-carboxypeptidase LdcB